MVEKLSSRKLAAFLAGLVYQAGLLALSAYKTVTPDALDKAQLIGAALTLTALGVQTALDWLKAKNGAPAAGGG